MSIRFTKNKQNASFVRPKTFGYPVGLFTNTIPLNVEYLIVAGGGGGGGTGARSRA